MFDIGATELLVLVIVAVLVIGPKDMPLALRTAGRWIGKVRRVSSHFRTGLDAMVREAEMEETEKKWRDRNAQVMADHPETEMTPLPAADGATIHNDESGENDSEARDERAAKDADCELPASTSRTGD